MSTIGGMGAAISYLADARSILGRWGSGAQHQSLIEHSFNVQCRIAMSLQEFANATARCLRKSWVYQPIVLDWTRMGKDDKR